MLTVYHKLLPKTSLDRIIKKRNNCNIPTLVKTFSILIKSEDMTYFYLDEMWQEVAWLCLEHKETREYIFY